MIAYVRHRGSLPLTTWLILITLATSIAAVFSGGPLYMALALDPERVWHGELWRLVTWPFVVAGPIALIFDCVIIYFFGGGLLARWGTRRFRRFVAGTILVAGVGTCLLAPLVPRGWWTAHLAGMALTDALVVAWALQFPHERVVVYWVLVVGGPTLAYGTVAVTVLFVVFFGLAAFLPELLACGFALCVMTGVHRRWWARLRAYRAHGRFGSVRGDRHGGPFAPN